GGGDRHMIALTLNGTGPKTEAKLTWENQKDFPYVPTLLARNGHLYFVNDKGVAGCFEMKTGKKVWFQRLPGAKFFASPVIVDNRIYAVSEEGEVFVLAAEPKYQ